MAGYVLVVHEPVVQQPGMGDRTLVEHGGKKVELGKRDPDSQAQAKGEDCPAGEMSGVQLCHGIYPSLTEAVLRAILAPLTEKSKAAERREQGQVKAAGMRHRIPVCRGNPARWPSLRATTGGRPYGAYDLTETRRLKAGWAPALRTFDTGYLVCYNLAA